MCFCCFWQKIFFSPDWHHWIAYHIFWFSRKMIVHIISRNFQSIGLARWNNNNTKTIDNIYQMIYKFVEVWFFFPFLWKYVLSILKNRSNSVINNNFGFKTKLNTFFSFFSRGRFPESGLSTEIRSSSNWTIEKDQCIQFYFSYLAYRTFCHNQWIQIRYYKVDLISEFIFFL